MAWHKISHRDDARAVFTIQEDVFEIKTSWMYLGSKNDNNLLFQAQLNTTIKLMVTAIRFVQFM